LKAEILIAKKILIKTFKNLAKKFYATILNSNIFARGVIDTDLAIKTPHGTLYSSTKGIFYLALRKECAHHKRNLHESEVNDRVLPRSSRSFVLVRQVPGDN